jgi:hypothetical protein
MVCANCGAIHNTSVSSDAQRADASPDSLPELHLKTARERLPEGAVELLGELDQNIDELVSEIEALRIREQAAPLEVGCALFGVFSTVVVVLALFATIARSLFGGWVFYVVLAIVVLAGVYKVVPKIIERAELRRLARKRTEIEFTLSRLRTERERVERLES